MQWHFENVYGPLGRPLGGLAWDGAALLVSDVNDGRILSFAGGEGPPGVYRKYTNRINGIAFGPDGLLYGCQEGSRRVVQYLENGAMKVTATLLNGLQHNHPCQLAIDGKGRIWFSDLYHGTLASGPQIFPYLPHQSVLRLSLHARPHTQWTIERMTFDTRGPRGLAVSPDQSTLYVAETDAGGDGVQELRAYPIDEDGRLGPYAVLHRFARDARGAHRGIAGLCVDARGNVLACAGWHKSGPGPMVYVFEPGGRIVESHPVPADRPLNCAFGGEDLSTLYVTTEDGCLLKAGHTGYDGLPAAGAVAMAART